MAILKAISGHGKLTDNKIRDYILGIGQFAKDYGLDRCQKITFINILADTEKTKWDKRMDDLRHSKDCDIPINNDVVRTYNHYIFSPSPKDNVTVDQLEKALQEWAERVFQNKFNIVIGYHNDNSKHVQHAHMIINNVNFDTEDEHKRIGTYVTPMCWEYASQLWQYMCKERGWYSFIDKQKADIDNSVNPNPANIIKETDNFTKETENLFKIDEEYFKRYKYYNPNLNYKRPYHQTKDWQNKPLKRPFSCKNGRNYTKGQLLAKKRGERLWADDIRNCIEIAFFSTTSVENFVRSLEKMGVAVELTSNKDFKYTHPKNRDHKVTGKKLGRDYSRQNIIYQYERQNEWNSRKGKPSPYYTKNYGEKVEQLSKIKAVIDICTVAGRPMPNLKQLANTLRTCSRFYAWNAAELENKKEFAESKEETQSIDAAKDVLNDIDKTSIEDLKAVAPHIRQTSKMESRPSIKNSQTRLQRTEEEINNSEKISKRQKANQTRKKQKSKHKGKEH